MTFRTLIRRSLCFHWRSHLGVVLGAAIGSAALIGALVVGDSVKLSLRDSALARLGIVELALDAKDRFISEELSIPSRLVVSVPILRLRGSAARNDGEARANQVQVLGVDDNFPALSNAEEADLFRTGVQTGLFSQLPPETALVNAALARHLKISVGDTLLLRMGKPTALAPDVAISPKSELTVAVRLKVAGIWADDQPLGGFDLQSRATPTFNVFVPLPYLQQQLGKLGRINLLLTSGENTSQANSGLESRWTLADAETHLTNSRAADVLEIRTSRVFLDPPIVGAALAANPNTQAILTYLATQLRVGTNITPYSMVTAAGPPWTPAGLRDDEIVVSQWLADDLHVKPGDEIALSYFLPESGAKLEEATNTFRVHSIIPMEMPWTDRTLMPDFPGIEKAESTSEWDAGFPLTYEIRKKDDDYWKQHRGTPKAFITLAAGQKLWGNRFGNLTAIRFPVPTNAIAANFQAELDKKILANLKPEELGLRFEPVRELALKAASESQDFGGLFLGFSFFLIIAALLLMAMLFQFGLEQRAPEVGTLLALGFTPKQVRNLLLREGVALGFIGGVVGTIGGIYFAKAMLRGLTTIWRDAVGATNLSFYVTAQTLIIGIFASVVVSTITIWLALRKFVKRAPRELLVGETQADPSKVQSLKPKVIGSAALVAGLALVGRAVAAGDTQNAGIFFGAGALVLIAGLSFVSAWLVKLGGAPVSDPARYDVKLRHAGPEAGVPFTTLALAVRGCARRRKRSLATVAMLACGSFLIVSIGVFRLDANRDATKRESGTGGFALIGETTLPVVQDLNAPAGRDFFALNETDLPGVNFVPFRVRAGDEASCLNLNRAQKPRLLGAKSEMLAGRFAFAKLVDGEMQQQPWAVLKPGKFYPKYGKPLAADEVAAIGDANSIQWAMHKKVGDTIDYVDERGQPFKVRIVGAVANSILQGQLIIDEAEFVKHFPGESGYRMFLIDVPSNAVSQVSATLSRAMQNVGLELTPTATRLNQFNAVQNTYLGTFQVLGGLGLLLGSVGLGIVVLRNVLERRSELAVLLAVGFRRQQVQRLLLVENGALLLLGLVIGIIAAAIAVLPALLSPAAQLPGWSLALTLGAILLNGSLWTWVATRFAVRGDLLAALRND